LFPSDHEYLHRLGEFYLRDNQPLKTKETWQRLVKEQGTPERLAELAGWYEQAEFPDEAAVAYEKAIQAKKSREWVFRLAALKFQKGDETNAVNLWLSVLDPATAKAEEFAEVANILEVHQKSAEAAPLRLKAVEKAPDNLEYHLANAKNLMARQKFETALAEFETLANQSTNEYFTAQGETGRLDAFRELGILEEKQKEWEKELDASPNSPQLLGKLARLYERAGQREKAIQLYERRRAAEPENMDFARSLAGIYKSAKQIEQAVALLNTLIEKDKNRARVYYKDLMDIYLGVDLREEAISAAEKIVSLAPADPEAHLDLAQVYGMYQKTDKALQEYRTALRLQPNEPDYYRQYGEALSGEKRWGEAQDAFRKMLDTSREDATRLTAVSSLARIYLQQDRLGELVTEFTRRVRNTPKKLGAYEELAAIHKEAGQVQKSVETLESGLQMVDDKEPALKSLIRVTYEALDFPKVRTYFEQLVATSGKPSSFELERLGSIYAQMGEVEKAKEPGRRLFRSIRKIRSWPTNTPRSSSAKDSRTKRFRPRRARSNWTRSITSSAMITPSCSPTLNNTSRRSRNCASFWRSATMKKRKKRNRAKRKSIALRGLRTGARSMPISLCMACVRWAGGTWAARGRGV
jgi:tetratricopeptide (TPR) repeat protein